MLKKTLCLSVDHTRVKLKDVEESIPGAEYINANYIKHLIEYNEINEETNSASNEKRPWESTIQVIILMVLGTLGRQKNIFFFKLYLNKKKFFSLKVIKISNHRILSLPTRVPIVIQKHI